MRLGERFRLGPVSSINANAALITVISRPNEGETSLITSVNVNAAKKATITPRAPCISNPRRNLRLGKSFAIGDCTLSKRLSGQQLKISTATNNIQTSKARQGDNIDNSPGIRRCRGSAETRPG